ncbi:MAG: DUF2079 domain-containing protein [Chloroflexi bacterium]|nr:DUF2079 domain-containing protein [Chloroflexota bacterium]
MSARSQASARIRLDVLALVLAPLLGLGFFAVTTWLAFARHDTFMTGRYDLEIYTQVVWNTAHGRPFETTLLKTNLSHLAEHVALVLLPVAALYRLYPDPKLLIAIQQASLALLGWPLFVVARQRLGSAWQAVVVLAGFYLTPALAGVALDDFHAVAVAALPLAAGMALILTGRPRLGAAIALLALPFEEETALVVIGVGAMLFLRRERLLGIAVAGIAAAYLALLILVVMPSFHDQRTLGSVEGNRTLNHFQEIRQDPRKVLDRVFGERGQDALKWVGLSTGGLALLSPATAITAGPSLAALLLQNRDDTFGRHWVAPLLVGVWMATALGLARLPSGWRRSAGLALLVVGAAVAYRLVSPLPGGGKFDPAALRPDERTRLLQRAVERIPDQGVVVASPNLVAHLADRPEAYVFPIDSHYAEELGWRKKRPDYYALDLVDELTNRATNSERLNPLAADKPFNVWSAGHKVMVLMDADRAPQHLLDQRWGDRVLLKGYDAERVAEGTRLTLYWERYDDARGRYDRELDIVDRNELPVMYEQDMALSAVYGLNKWRLGQTIMDEVLIPPADGPIRVRIKWVAEDKRRPFLLQNRAEHFDLMIDASR